MRDNVRSLVGHREKKAGEGSGKDFYASVDDYCPKRVDLQYSDGTHRCVPYAHIHQLDFFPADSSIAADDPDVIFIDCPSYSRSEISGVNLMPLFEALKAESVVWIREANSDESANGTAPFVLEIAHVMFTDWRVELERVEQSREDVLGKRQYPSLRETLTE
ncbi:MAG TPA: hypothetical protein VGO27_23225 [Candidatus Acidoferrum sp.]|jgi:hypothetical protein|nr:hypothetical protein [Candidatus Acidoferrum sp.]